MAAAPDLALAGKGKGLRSRDLGPLPTREKIRTLDPVGQDAQKFSAKWQAALDRDAGRLMRAFPTAFYWDLKSVDRGKIPGGDGVIVGDAHLKNFGVLKVGGKTRVGVVDIDDSGKGPVALDAVRYFVTLHFATGDKKLVKHALKVYAAALVENAPKVEAPAFLKPDWDKRAKRRLEELTSGDRLRLEVDASSKIPVTAVSKQDHALVVSGFHSDSGLRGYRVLDVASVVHSHGGSGGLKRFRVLVERDGERTVLELKEQTRPAVAAFGLPQPGAKLRMKLLRKAFWDAPEGDGYSSVTLGGTVFTVKDRLKSSAMDPDEMSGKDRRAAIEAQVKYLASLHRGGWQGADPEVARQWLAKSTKTLAKRWQAIFDQE